MHRQQSFLVRKTFQLVTAFTTVPVDILKVEEIMLEPRITRCDVWQALDLCGVGSKDILIRKDICFQIGLHKLTIENVIHSADQCTESQKMAIAKSSQLSQSLTSFAFRTPVVECPETQQLPHISWSMCKRRVLGINKPVCTHHPQASNFNGIFIAFVHCTSVPSQSKRFLFTMTEEKQDKWSCHLCLWSCETTFPAGTQIAK